MSKLQREVEKKILKQGKSRFVPENAVFKKLQEIIQQGLVKRNIFFLSKSPTEKEAGCRGLNIQKNNTPLPTFVFVPILIHNSFSLQLFLLLFICMKNFLSTAGQLLEQTFQYKRKEFSLPVFQKQHHPQLEVIASQRCMSSLLKGPSYLLHDGSK